MIVITTNICEEFLLLDYCPPSLQYYPLRKDFTEVPPQATKHLANLYLFLISLNKLVPVLLF